MRNKFLFLLFMCICSVNADGIHAQNNNVKIDSLYSAFLKETVDTGKVNLLLALAAEYGDKAKGISFVREALELSERIKYDKGICLANLAIAGYYFDQLKYTETLKSYLRALVPAEKLNMSYELLQIYNGLGIVYSNQNKNEQALKYFLKMARIAEQYSMGKRLAVAYNNLGITYKNLGRYSEAVNYYKKALDEFEKSNFIRGIASASNNLGTIAHIQKNDEIALEYYNRAIENFRKIKDTASEAGIYTNIGDVYNDKEEYDKALEFYLKGLSFSEKFNKNNFRIDAYEGLAEVYANLKNYERAYYYNKRHLALKDSMSDEEGMRQVQEMERRLEIEKQEREIEILKQKEEIQDLKVRSQSEKLKQSQIIIYSVGGILLIVMAMSFFLFNANKQIKKTNSELAEKKKEIQDSINYAKNIQQAMLPDVSLLGNHFPEGFGLYLPKDVVSGDFYWFNELNEKLYFAVADCTGHGVPGAFMSMIGIDKLNLSLNDQQIEDPSEILSSLNVSIKKALKQKDDSSASKDGMDIAICSFDKQNRTLHYSGANRPLWILRNNEIIEYKATKATIAGFTETFQKYESHHIQLEINDRIYVFTDGFADQFGGANKKKYMTRQLKQTLINIHQTPMHDQEFELKRIFNEWKGDIPQVDDVLVLGFKIG